MARVSGVAGSGDEVTFAIARENGTETGTGTEIETAIGIGIGIGTGTEIVTEIRVICLRSGAILTATGLRRVGIGGLTRGIHGVRRSDVDGRDHLR